MRVLFNDDGFSTVGTALALLLTLSLVFSAGRIYRISSEAAFVQEVADASVLAAQNEVAEFMVAVRACDAAVLTLSLTGLVLHGAGVVALCVPSGFSAATKLLEAAEKVLDARDDFAQSARETLLRTARSLPFLAAVNAASVAAANGDASGSAYFAAAFLVPSEVQKAPSSEAERKMKDDADAARESVREKADEVRRDAEEADLLAQEARAVKEKAFLVDCGNDPGYCMSERAASLAHLPASANPCYSSIDTWSFAVALERSRSYYEARLRREAPFDASVEEGARSALRRVYYEYALGELEKAYVQEDDGRFRASFPLLPSNTEEMRETALYSDSRYPISVDASGRSVMHAWDGCPQAGQSLSRGSIEYMEQQGFSTCSACGFSASSLGKVAAATSLVETGFEFHYNVLAGLAEEYEEARSRVDEKAGDVRSEAQGLFDSVLNAMRSAAAYRIDIVPPGSQGSIVLAVALPSESEEDAAVPFVQGSMMLGVRAAVAAATMIEDGSQEGRTIISALFDGLIPQGGVLASTASLIAECWSNLLSAYGEGQDALESSLKNLLDSIPLFGASGLGDWAEDAFEKGVSSLGLQPVKLESLKPVLVNSGYVSGKGSDSFSVRYTQLKKTALQVSGPSTDLFSSAMDSFEDYLVSEISAGAESVELAVIDIPVLDVSVPVTMALPPAATDKTIDFLRNAFSAVRSAYVHVTGVRVWE